MTQPSIVIENLTKAYGKFKALDNSKRSKLRQVFITVDVLIVLYIVLDAIAQALPPHYSPISQAESLLAVGPYGYIMTINFLNRGGYLIYSFGYVIITSASTLRIARPKRFGPTR